MSGSFTKSSRAAHCIPVKVAGGFHETLFRYHINAVRLTPSLGECQQFIGMCNVERH